MTEQRTVVLVGATSGLGREAAKQLAADGHRLVLVGRDPDRAAALGRELPATTVIATDVSVREGVERVAKEVSAVTDRVDVLVNNAGVMTGRGRPRRRASSSISQCTISHRGR
jgi:short-subunit dehydrogenase